MKPIVPYLNFDGNTRDAMTFYSECLGGELSISTFGDMGAGDNPATKDRVMHARLSRSDLVLMASDTMPGATYNAGNNFSLSIECASIEEQDALFTSLARDGKVTMPLQNQFWGARFGMLTDRFGIGWMLNHELPKQA